MKRFKINKNKVLAILIALIMLAAMLPLINLAHADTGPVSSGYSQR